MANWSLRRDIKVGDDCEVDLKYYLECSECRAKEYNLNPDDVDSGNWGALSKAHPECPVCKSKMMF